MCKIYGLGDASWNLETRSSALGAAGEEEGGPLQIQRQKCTVLLAVTPGLNRPGSDPFFLVFSVPGGKQKTPWGDKQSQQTLCMGHLGTEPGVSFRQELGQEKAERMETR